MSKRTKIIIVIIIIVLAAVSRLIEHPHNFTPIVAMSLFAGCYLRKRWAFVLPLLAMLISDYFIGLYSWKLMAAVYLSIALAFFIGWILKRNKKWYSLISASLASSLAFFIITNFAVWEFSSWYPHTIDGLVRCYTLAIPFFRNTIAGDLFYSGIFFGLYEVVLIFSDKKVLNFKVNK